MKKIIHLAVALQVTTSLLAQKIADVTLNFYDGSILYGTAKLQDIKFKTSYGNLNIPLKDVAQIQFGLEKDESIANDINKSIQIVANANDENTIASAKENILKHGLKAIYYLENYLNKNTATYPENLQDIINDILSTNNINDYSFEDAIILNNGDKISGTVDFKSIEFTNSFLKTNIPTNVIKSMDISYYDNSSGISQFILKANKHIMANPNGGWLNTGIKVKKGQTVEISARGEIILASLDNKKYTPDGNIVGQESVSGEINDPTYFNYGTLIFKIGTNGKNLKAGTNARYIADESGVLYLSIYETVYSEKNTGNYQVKVSIK